MKLAGILWYRSLPSKTSFLVKEKKKGPIGRYSILSSWLLLFRSSSFSGSYFGQHHLLTRLTPNKYRHRTLTLNFPIRIMDPSLIGKVLFPLDSKSIYGVLEDQVERSQPSCFQTNRCLPSRFGFDALFWFFYPTRCWKHSTISH